MATISSLVWALPLFPLAMAQQDLTSNTSSDGLSSTTLDTMPSPSAGDTGPQQDNNRHTIGLVNYYFVFIALIVLAAFLTAFIMYRRKRRYGVVMSRSRHTALEQDLNTWDAARTRRRYWQGRWRSAETTSREEGLNEDGEAPPPYVPKTQDEELRPRTQVSTVAVPMQALSREQAGLKPPDYSEVNTYAAAGTAPAYSEGPRQATESAATSSQQSASRPGAQST